MSLVSQVILRRGPAIVPPITPPQRPNRNRLSLARQLRDETSAGRQAARPVDQGPGAGRFQGTAGGPGDEGFQGSRDGDGRRGGLDCRGASEAWKAAGEA